MIVTHKFVSPKTEQTDPTLVGPNEWNAVHAVVDSSNTIGACDYNFPAQQPGGNLIIGSNPIVLVPLPQGVVIGSSLYISGGVGTPEACVITGVTGNTVSVTCVNAHSGAWTIGSATGGLQEAIAIAPASGSKVVIACNITLYTNVVDMGKNVFVEKYGGVAINNTATFSIYTALNVITNDLVVFVPDTDKVTYRANVPNLNMNGNYSVLATNANNYPPDSYFGNGNFPVFETVRGATVEGTGVAGYSLTAGEFSTNKSSLGVFGFAGAMADGCSCFGGNFLTTNARQQSASVGNDSATLYGLEIDVNVVKKSDGTDPQNFSRGLFITGASTVTSGSLMAIDIDSPGTFQTPKLKWNSGLRLEDGAATNALDIGCLNTGNGTGSQAIVLRSRDTSGVNRAGEIVADPEGNIVIAAGPGGRVTLSDSNLNAGASVIPNGAVPYLQAINQLSMAQGSVPPTSSSAGIQGFISWDANYIYICIAANTWKRAALATW